MKRKAFIFAVSLVYLCSLAATGWGQRRTMPDEEEEKYNSILSFGVSTNTNSGILGGFSVRYSGAVNADFMGKDQFQYLSLELVNVKSPKEYSSGGLPLSGATIIRNKLNYLFVIRPQYGREVALFKRNASEGITVSGILAAGPSIGLEKPYMVRFQENGRTLTQPYIPGKSSHENAISAGFFSGLGRSKIVPGLHAKAALSFELSAFRNSVTGVEVGFLTELFSRQINITPYGPNNSLFTSGYLTLYFGTKK